MENKIMLSDFFNQKDELNLFILSKEDINKWVKRLRNPESKQASGCLGYGKTFCCLGHLLIELNMDHIWIEMPNDDDDDDDDDYLESVFYDNGIMVDDSYNYPLINIKGNTIAFTPYLYNPETKEYKTADTWNDINRLSLPKIADLIEETVKLIDKYIELHPEDEYVRWGKRHD